MIPKVNVLLLYFLNKYFQYKRSNTSWRKAKPVTWEIRISGAQIEFRIQAKIRISRWSGSIKGRESKITGGICNSCPATSTIYRMVFPNHWKDLNIVIFFLWETHFCLKKKDKKRTTYYNYYYEFVSLFLYCLPWDEINCFSVLYTAWFLKGYVSKKNP